MPLLITAIIAVFTAGRMARHTPAYLPTSGSLHQVRAASLWQREITVRGKNGKDRIVRI